MVTRCKPLLGAFVEITIDQDQDHAAIEYAFNAIQKIQGLMGFYQPGSKLNRINRYAYTQAVDYSSIDRTSAQHCKAGAAPLTWHI